MKPQTADTLVETLLAGGQDVTSLLNAFLAGFPTDTTSWGKATDELPSMLRWLNEYGVGPRVRRTNVENSPALWNTAYRNAILAGFSELPQQGKGQFFTAYKHWLVPGAEDES